MADKLSDKEINDLLEAVSKEEYRDKDYSVLEGMERDSVSKIRTAFDKGYKQGYGIGVASQGFMEGYTEEEVKKREKEVEKKCIEQMKVLMDGTKSDAEANEKQAYQKGLDKAWETAKYIASLTGNDVKRREIIGDCAAWYAFTHYTASEVIANIEAYEQKQKQKQDEIKVGDEVIYDGTEYRGIVTKIHKSDKTYYRCVRYDGDLSTENSDNPPTKTGRHFDQIEEVLKALKEA